MKASVSRGGGFLGALNYVFDEGPKATGDKKPERCGGNMSGTTPQALAAEFAVTRQLRPDIAKPVWHCSLALPGCDRLSSEKWSILSADFMREMGMDPDNFLYDVQRHQDTDHDHIHILASRIGLDGSVWHGKFEVFKAIEATQKLEKMHGLTLTPGLGDVRKERKTLTHKELNMSIRTGMQSPKIVIQSALDDVLSNGPLPAQEFIKRLEALSVQAVPNIASTGMMNGFSFEYEGIAFTGSKLGKAYAWKQLSERVLYEQTRDFEALTEARRVAANAGSAERDGATNTADAGAGAELAPRRSEGAEIVRPGDSSAAADDGRASAGNNREIDSWNAAESAGAGLADNQSIKPGSGVVGERERAEISSVDNVELDKRINRVAEESSGSGAEINRGYAAERESTEQSNYEPIEKAELMENMGNSGGGSGTVGGSGAGWADRFKRNSAAKRRTDMGKSDGTGKKVSENNRIEARQIDPTAYLQHCGFTVKKEGRHLSVRVDGEERYRVTQKPDGHWITCDNYSNGIGDNIALVQDIEPGTSFAESVYRLSGASSAAPNVQRINQVIKRVPPVMPYQTDFDIRRGREYLFGRGISQEVIEHAEACGMVRYAGRYGESLGGGVLFVGYDDQGTAQNVMRRAVDELDPVQKRDLRGTDKSCPQVLPGSPDGAVWVVEGGTDALAAHTLALRQGKPVPTVLVTGGANARSFLEAPWVQKILRLAKKIVVAFENETDAQTQAKTDSEHEAQALRIEQISSRQVLRWKPADPAHKDVAALNLAELQALQAGQERGPDMQM